MKNTHVQSIKISVLSSYRVKGLLTAQGHSAKILLARRTFARDFLQRNILAKSHFSKEAFWQRVILAKKHFGK